MLFRPAGSLLVVLVLFLVLLLVDDIRNLDVGFLLLDLPGQDAEELLRDGEREMVRDRVPDLSDDLGSQTSKSVQAPPA
jgi:hypothetical protein